MTIDIHDLKAINKIYSDYEENFKCLERALKLNNITAYFSGHSSIEIRDTMIIDQFKTCYVDFYKTACKINLRELENLQVNVREQQQSLETLVKE